jgi:hypothetical protein
MTYQPTRESVSMPLMPAWAPAGCAEKLMSQHKCEDYGRVDYGRCTGS